MAQIKVEVIATGPMFNGRAKPMTVTAVSNGIKQLMESGEERLDMKLRPKPAGVFKSRTQAGKRVSQGNYRKNVYARHQGLVAFINDSGVKYGSWLEVGRAGTRFRGYGQYRETATILQKVSQRVFLNHMRKLARKMNS